MSSCLKNPEELSKRLLVNGMHSRTRIKSGPCCARFHRRRRRRRRRHCRAPLSLRPCPRTSCSSSKSSSITTLKELPDVLSSLQLSNAPGRSVSIPSAGTPGAVAALLRLLLFTRPVQLLEESRGAIETTARQRSRALRRSEWGVKLTVGMYEMGGGGALSFRPFISSAVLPVNYSPTLAVLPVVSLSPNR